MKRTAGILAFALCSIILLHAQEAQDKSKGTEMTGMVCNADSVVTTEGKAVCDETKGGKSPDMVFIDDQGKATKIANPKMLAGMSGKKVKIKCEMKGDEIMVYDVGHLGPG
ncbi:MAG: hypothetical protein LAO78_10720 [Acidobacteriia bacterium]|nr:hypothetical protein [Terriglobia bacterium]